MTFVRWATGADDPLPSLFRALGWVLLVLLCLWTLPRWLR